jgi:hypothetical protein
MSAVKYTIEEWRLAANNHVKAILLNLLVKNALGGGNNKKFSSLVQALTNTEENDLLSLDGDALQDHIHEALRNEMDLKSMKDAYSFDSLITYAGKLPANILDTVHLNALSSLRYPVDVANFMINVSFVDSAEKEANTKRFLEEHKKYIDLVLYKDEVNQNNIRLPYRDIEVRQFNQARYDSLYGKYNKNQANPLLVVVDDRPAELQRLRQANKISSSQALDAAFVKV